MTHTERLTNTLRELVAFKTVTGSRRENRELYDYVKRRLDGLAVTFEETESNGFCSLIVRTSNNKPKLALQAHVDVVTADPEQFELFEKDGRAYGRGVYDMKFAVACYIELFTGLGNRLSEYDMAIVLTSDEEIGGDDGAGVVVAQGFRSDVVVLPDGGDNWRIEQSAKGAWEVRVVCRGIAAHGSQPWNGDNASQKLVGLIAELHERLPNDPAGLTCSVTQLEAKTSHNQIPGLATASVDIRYQTDEQLERARVALETLAKQYDATIEPILMIDPVIADLSNPLMVQFDASVKAVRGTSSPPTMSYGASDARFFANEGMPVIIMRPDGGGAHGGSEWIDIDSMHDYYKVLEHYVLAVASNTTNQ